MVCCFRGLPGWPLPDCHRNKGAAMPNPPFDPVQYKASQKQDWSNVAAGWKKWWKTMDRSAGPASDRLVDLTELGPGRHVLDVATGIGEPAVTAARKVGPAGRVIATDQAPLM